jgi:hypothetical protein
MMLSREEIALMCEASIGLRTWFTRERCEYLRDLALQAIDRPAERGEAKLTKPAWVGNTSFAPGVSERLVIERAQREYEHQQKPEQIAERERLLDTFVRVVNGPHPTRAHSRCEG